MSGYPQPPPGYGYAYGGSGQPYTAPPYGAPPPPQPQQHHQQQQPQPYSSSSYGAPSAPYKPPKDGHQGYGGSGYPPSAPGYANPFASLVPSAFPPGTDPSVVACFQMADQDGSGLIDDKELQGALSSYNQSFSLRTVRLLMYHFTNSNTRKIGNPLPLSFHPQLYCVGWISN